MKHAGRWLTLAWQANGKEPQIALASQEFIKMLVSIAMAALAYLGIKGNLSKAVKIANSPPPTAMPALAVAGSGTVKTGAGAGAGVAIGPPGAAGPIAGGGMMMSDESKGKTHSEHAKERGAQGRRTVVMAQQDAFDTAYILSADGDYTHAAQFVRDSRKRVFAAASTSGAQLAKVVNSFIRLPKEWFADCYK